MKRLDRALAKLKDGTPTVEPEVEKNGLVFNLANPKAASGSHVCADCPRERTGKSMYCWRCRLRNKRQRDRERDARIRAEATPTFTDVTAPMLERVFAYMRRRDCTVRELEGYTGYRRNGWQTAINKFYSEGNARVRTVVWKKFEEIENQKHESGGSP